MPAKELQATNVEEKVEEAILFVYQQKVGDSQLPDLNAKIRDIFAFSKRSEEECLNILLQIKTKLQEHFGYPPCSLGGSDSAASIVIFYDKP